MDAAGPSRFWWWAVVAVVIGQAGLALDLFGPRSAVAGLTDSRPLVSGRHPLHLYHATLGAEAFRERFAASCYDPAFQAGYPKTPIFDGGSRPAEAAVLIAGRAVTPATAYKCGLFAILLLVPIAFALAGWGFGLSPMGVPLAAAVGSLLAWSPTVRALLESGHVDRYLVGLAAIAFVGGLARYASQPGPMSWCLLAGSAAVGWYAEPVVWLGLVPATALYYVAFAPRFGPAWHLGLIGVGVVGVGANLWWLLDWARFWWLRQPTSADLAPELDWQHLLDSPAKFVPGSLAPFEWAAIGLGLCGLAAMARNGRAATAAVAGLAGIYALIAQRLGCDSASVVALAVLALAAADLIASWWAKAPAGGFATVLAVSASVALGWGGVVGTLGRTALGLDATPLKLGLSVDQQRFAAGLREATSREARILIEDGDTAVPGWNWTALLSSLADRLFLGGLDPEAGVEHAYLGMRRGCLNGRPFAEWTAGERAEFCRLYNVGWVACRTPEAVEFWGADPTVAKEVARFRDGGEVVLFELLRPKSFVLSGTATVERQDAHRIVLTDLAPDPATGAISLSWHYQPGFRASPAVAWIERDPDPNAPVPRLKLRIPGPISRIVLTWDAP